MGEKESGGLNNDAITGILLLLPVKSVCRFRCVSKRWLSLTTDPYFTRTHAATTPAAVGGIFLQDEYAVDIHGAEFFSLDSDGDGGGGQYCKDRDPTLSFLSFQGSPPRLLDSCNGLILCQFPYKNTKNYKRPCLFSVCNPMNKEHVVVTFSQAPQCKITSCSLAFDPSRSPNFSIVLMVSYDNANQQPSTRNVMYIYSSNSGLWTTLLEINPRFRSWNYNAYWNGYLLLWDRDYEHPRISIVDVEGMRLRDNSLFPWPKFKGLFLYMGMSMGRLHFIRSSCQFAFIEILEMASESSGWQLYKKVDISFTMYNSHFRMISGFVREEGGDRLLFRMADKIFSYGLQNKEMKTYGARADALRYQIFPLIPTLFSLNVAPSTQEWVCWKSEHDQLLIDLMVDHSLQINKNIFGFKLGTLHGMTKKFNEEPQLNYTVSHLKNRLKCYKKEFKTVSSILTIDGFSWVPGENLVKASEDLRILRYDLCMIVVFFLNLLLFLS